MGGWTGAFVVFMAVATDVAAANRCVLPSGRILYTDEICESIGGKVDRAMKNEISVVPLPAESRVDARKSKGASPKAAAAPFRKAADAPRLTICYDPANARPEIGAADVENAVRAAIALWNDGCNVSYEFLGRCVDSTARDQRPIDYKVWWASWDDSLRLGGDGSKTFRDHTIAAASPRMGVALNREVDAGAFQRQWRRSIVHEFGHVVGIGHSADSRDIMYSGGRRATPTEHDLAACNAAVALRFGVRSP